MRRGTVPTSPRQRTQEDIFALIKSGRAATRPTLVEVSGLSASTVSHAVAKLLAAGRITETEPAAKGRGAGSGRPAAILAPVVGGGPTAGLDFGARHLLVAIGDNLGNPLAEVEIALEENPDPDAAIELAVAQLRRLQAEHGLGELSTVAAGVPGPLSRATGLVCAPAATPAWVGLAPIEELQRRLPGVRVQVENDAVLGACGELYRGVGREHADFLYVKASHGIGAGLVINGQLYTGATGLAGEIGHAQLAGRSELCRCGSRGCVEAVVNATVVREQLAQTHTNLDPAQISLSTLNGAVAERILNEAGRMLGKVLADVCNLLNPTAIILGGELGVSGEPLVAGVRASVQRFAQTATTAAIEVRSATFGRRAELVGALALAGSLNQV